MSPTVRTAMAVLLLAGCVITAVAGREETKAEGTKSSAAGGDMVQIRGLDKIDTLLGFIQKITGKAVVYPSTLRGTKIKIYGNKVELPRGLLMKFIRTILEMNGYTMREAPGNVLQVLPVKEMGPPITLRIDSRGKLPDSSDVVTQVIKLKHASSQKLTGFVKQSLTPQTGKVVSFDDLNMLFVTDAAYRVNQIMKMISLVDVPAPRVQLEAIKLKYAPPTTVARTLDTLMQRKAVRERSGKRALERAYIMADERSSSLIVLGLPEEIEEVRTLLKKLDVPPEPDKGTFHIYKLKNTSAEELAKVLSQIYQKKVTGKNPRVPPSSRVNFSIVPEPNTNSLLIIAPADLYAEMEKVIKKLDVRRPQVLIEVMLVELSMDNTREWGVEAVTGDAPKEGRDTFFGGTGFGLSSIALDDNLRPVMVPSIGTGLFAGVFHGTDYIPVILRAWETLGDVDVLAVPRVLTNDNSDATISIGDEVPYQKVVIQNEIRDITWASATASMKLKITPHISEAEHLRLDLDFLVERFGPQPPDSASPPPKSIRNATTRITIPDRSTVIIGGLTHTTLQTTVVRVPLLGRIPLLGALFRKTNVIRRKTNLFIFITPRILREENFGDLKGITNSVELDMRRIKGKKWREHVKHWGMEEKGRVRIKPLKLETKIKDVDGGDG